MFDGKYLDWNTKKIKSIISHFGYQFFHGKKVLDLGSGHGDVGASLYRLGAEVTCVDAREEHLKVAAKKFPGIKTAKKDLDHNWNLTKQSDIILDLGVICHLKDFEKHLNEVCNAGTYIVIETAVADSDDPSFNQVLTENKSIYDWSFNGFSSFPSAAAIERVLDKNGMSFKRIDNKNLNSGTYVYDWVVSNTGQCSKEKRRLWFVEKKSSPKAETTSQILPAPPPVLPNNILSISTSIQPSLIRSDEISRIPYQNSNVKIALCISGYMRSFEVNYDALLNNIINKTNCDVFIHTWDHLGSKTRGYDYKVAALRTFLFEEKIHKLYSPKKMVIEETKTFDSNHALQKYTDGRDAGSVLSMYYKIQACNDLKTAYEKENNFTYDLVIRCRADLSFQEELKFNEALSSNKIFIPKYGDFSGMNDQFAFGKSSLMDMYSSLYSNIQNYCLKGIVLNPEILLRYHLVSNHIQVERPIFRYHIRRNDGKTQDNELLEKKLGFLK